MRAEDIILLLVIVAVGVAIWCFGLRQWPCERPPAEPIVEDADIVWKPDSGLSPILKPPMAIPRPLIEYPEAGLTYLLTKPSPQLEKEVSKVLLRPLIEYPNSVINLALERPQTSPATLPRPLVEYSDGVLTMVLEELQTSPAVEPRPLVEYADSAITLALASLLQELISSATQAQPRPLIEYPDAAWSGSLSPPSGLLPGP